MLVSDYNYDLPEERIAKFPPEKRGKTRLLVLNRQTGDVQDSYYQDLADFLNPGDVLILNDTKVMPARLFCVLPDGRKRELVVLENHHEAVQKVMYRGKLHAGDVLKICRSGLDKTTAVLEDSPEIYVERVLGGGIAEVKCEEPLPRLAERFGAVPLPPYLRRDATTSDTERYQTVWAKHLGSAAAPTASLNMTTTLLEKLKKKGVKICFLTLHVGLGTFLPIRSDKVEEHKMHSEWFEIPEETLKTIVEIKAKNQTKPEQTPNNLGAVLNSDNRGKTEQKPNNSSAVSNSDKTRPRRRIVAVGTTVARTLEYYAKTGKTSGEDDIFIYPGFQFQMVDALLTNFHAPKSTVLMLAAAFAGWDNLHTAYDYAVKQNYNFLSYGDSMLIMGDS